MWRGGGKGFVHQGRCTVPYSHNLLTFPPSHSPPLSHRKVPPRPITTKPTKQQSNTHHVLLHHAHAALPHAQHVQQQPQRHRHPGKQQQPTRPRPVVATATSTTQGAKLPAELWPSVLSFLPLAHIHHLLCLFPPEHPALQPPAFFGRRLLLVGIASAAQEATDSQSLVELVGLLEDWEQKAGLGVDTATNIKALAKQQMVFLVLREIKETGDDATSVTSTILCVSTQEELRPWADLMPVMFDMAQSALDSNADPYEAEDSSLATLKASMEAWVEEMDQTVIALWCAGGRVEVSQAACGLVSPRPFLHATDVHPPPGRLPLRPWYSRQLLCHSFRSASPARHNLLFCAKCRERPRGLIQGAFHNRMWGRGCGD